MSKVKVAYNACFGGFSLSRNAVLLGRKLSGDAKWGGPCIKGDYYDEKIGVDYDYGMISCDVARHDKVLVEIIEILGESASGMCADLRIAEVDSLYRIDEYDGCETVEQPDDLEWINPFK